MVNGLFIWKEVDHVQLKTVVWPKVLPNLAQQLIDHKVSLLGWEDFFQT